MLKNVKIDVENQRKVKRSRLRTLGKSGRYFSD